LILGVKFLGCGMAYAYPGAGALDYSLCHYEGSRLLFRGPARSLDRPFVAVLGATESYGKYVERPYSDLIQGRLGLSVVNLSCINAGVDVYLNEEPLTGIAARAEVAVVQVMGAQNISNRFYTVHPRRNDRFLGATAQLQALYRNVDFTEFSFTRHMLTVLESASRDRFALVVAELRQAWVTRMKLLADRLPKRRILLWMADGLPPQRLHGSLKRDPLLIDAEMLAEIRPHFSDYVEVTPSAEARTEGPGGQVFGELELLAARALPGQAFHREVAEQLSVILERMI
jgi:hypothetical protein